MTQSVVVRLSKGQAYRHLHALCQNDTLFAIIDYGDKWEDKDFERIVISDQQALKAGARSAVIGTVRLLPHGNGTALMFVNKDAIWHQEISESGERLFTRFIERARKHFGKLDLLIRETAEGMDFITCESESGRESMARTILILAANPKDTSRLRLDQEVREIENGLQRARKRDEFAIKQVWAARPVDIRRAMLDSKPNIVHFCGHGGGDDGIALEDEAGNAKLIGSEALAGFFELFADEVECVILNACYSEVQAEAIARHIKYVIGMRKGVEDTAAIEFAVALYDALGAGESVEFAYKLACNAIQWADLPGHLTPALKTQSEVSRFLNKVYDSQRAQDFDQWSVFSSVRGFEERIQLLNRTLDGATTFEIKALSTEAVGVNKSLPMLYGRVEFEYKVVLSKAIQPNVYFCMIPMQETGIGRTGLIEVGTDIQADPRNPYSPYRKRFYVPMKHYGDGQWHQAGISFDFRQTPMAFYSIFAPRINEGCSDPAPAHLLTTNLQVFSSE